jgi:hypothetical protein
MRGYLLVAIASLLTSSIGRLSLHIPRNPRTPIGVKEFSPGRDATPRFVATTDAARASAGHGTPGTTQSLNG